ncbi:MAG: hypothetical protein ACRC4M_01085 [Mycoplasma sp.]
MNSIDKMSNEWLLKLLETRDIIQKSFKNHNDTIDLFKLRAFYKNPPYIHQEIPKEQNDEIVRKIVKYHIIKNYYDLAFKNEDIILLMDEIKENNLDTLDPNFLEKITFIKQNFIQKLDTILYMETQTMINAIEEPTKHDQLIKDQEEKEKKKSYWKK